VAFDSDSDQASTLYDAVGGEETFRRLVGEFYVGVVSDPKLREMYPDEDLGPAADRLATFLMQYWGGPTTYSENRGHPRLRMRHAPFVIDEEARDRWLRHMRAALDRLELPADQDEVLWNYLKTAAHVLQNH
jgi:hemoglobin